MASSSLLDRLPALLTAAPVTVAAVYVFGSVARGTESSSSDVDLGVLLAESPASTLAGRLFDYEAELERQLARPVQIVILNAVPPDLAHRVLREGRVVLERDRSVRLRFEVRTRNLYFDLLPALTRYRRRAVERASPVS